MRKNLILNLFITAVTALSLLSMPDISAADLITLTEEEPKYKYTSLPSQKAFIQRAASSDSLVTNATVGITQGVDSNPLLDSSHAVDSYTQEMVDMHYAYPLFTSILGFTKSKFGFSATNINYYKKTDVNMFNSLIDYNIDMVANDKITVTSGYALEIMWFPNDEDGTYIGNEFNTSFKQFLTKWLYHKATYRFRLKNFTSNKALDGGGIRETKFRKDTRNIFEHELGAYIGEDTKVKVMNQFYLNDSNYSYTDFYDYSNYRVGGSIIQFFTDKLYGIAGFFYQRRNYKNRFTLRRQSRQKDNLYTVTCSLLYDIRRDVSLFVNYSHSENHSNEPFDQYVDTLYSGGVYYNF